MKEEIKIITHLEKRSVKHEFIKFSFSNKNNFRESFGGLCEFYIHLDSDTYDYSTCFNIIISGEIYTITFRSEAIKVSNIEYKYACELIAVDFKAHIPLNYQDYDFELYKFEYIARKYKVTYELIED